MPPGAAAAARVFAGTDRVTVHAVPGGLIHASCRVTDARGAPLCLLQRLNTRVFRDPARLMENLARVTAHLAGSDPAPDDGAITPALLPWPDGAVAWVDDAGDWWRAWRFLEGRVQLGQADTAARAWETGRAFGRFQVQIASLGGAPLHALLPHFHDTPRRFAQLEEAFTRDPAGRAREAAPAIAALRARREDAARLARLEADGVLARAIAHNDAKIGNLLFDVTGRRPPVVIDLDTVMPGLAVHDFGDMARTVAATAPEDAADPARMDVDVERFAQLADGYRSAASRQRPVETAYLVVAAQVITLEQAARFLTDYLLGDTYYDIAHPRHNLDRALAQTALAAAFRTREPELTTVSR